MNILFFFYKFLLVSWAQVIALWRVIEQPEKRVRKKLVIVGGGFAGAFAAKKLEDYFNVILIDTKDYFEFTPSILRTLVEPNHISKIQIYHHDYLNLTKTTIMRQKVLQVNPNNSILLEGGENVDFDYLLLACGSSYQSPFKEANVVMASRGSTLSRTYKQLQQSNRVLVIGGGLVGVETAAEIVERFPYKEVTLVHSGPHLLSRSQMPIKSVNYVHKRLIENKVDVILGERVVEQEGSMFRTDQKRCIYADMAYVCTGIKSNSDLLRLHFADCIDRDGFVVVNDHLQLQSRPNIFVAGDMANIKEEKLAQNAEYEASVVIKNIILHANNENATLYKYSPAPRMMLVSLGKYDGAFVYRSFSLTGLLPAIMKEFVEWKVMTAYRYRTGKLFNSGL